MVKLAKKSVDRLLLSEYLGDYEKRGTKLKLRISLTLTLPYFSWLGRFRDLSCTPQYQPNRVTMGTLGSDQQGDKLHVLICIMFSSLVKRAYVQFILRTNIILITAELYSNNSWIIRVFSGSVCSVISRGPYILYPTSLGPIYSQAKSNIFFA